jgi:hypothetical protein
MRRRGRGALAVVALLVLGCADSPSLATAPPATVRLAIRVEVSREPIVQFFARDVHARLTHASGTVLEWVVTDVSPVATVPDGRSRLDVWTVVFGDTQECSTQEPDGPLLCSQPILGTGQVCTAAIDPAAGDALELRFRVLRDERCELSDARAEPPAAG